MKKEIPKTAIRMKKGALLGSKLIMTFEPFTPGVIFMETFLS